jgi:hypothetical protein
MGVQKGGATLGESVDMRGLRKGVPAKVADPIVLVVDGNEQDIGPWIGAER